MQQPLVNVVKYIIRGEDHKLSSYYWVKKKFHVSCKNNKEEEAFVHPCQMKEWIVVKTSIAFLRVQTQYLKEKTLRHMIRKRLNRQNIPTTCHGQKITSQIYQL